MDRHGHRLTSCLQLTREIMPAAARRPATEEETLFHAVQVWLKGLETPLPAGITFQDKGYKTRSEARVRWWDHEATLLPDAVIVEENIRRDLPAVQIAPAARYRYEQAMPVFFGHYWMSGPRGFKAPLPHVWTSALRRTENSRRIAGTANAH